MNLIELLDYIDIDVAIKADPVEFLLFKETFLENGYSPLNWGGYHSVFNKEALNQYFQNELTYDEILQTKASYDEFPFQDEFLPLIKKRLEEIKALPNPSFSEEQMMVLKAIANSPSDFISLCYITKSIHKNELFTLLAFTEWDFWFQSVSGFGLDYISIGFKFTTIFDIDDLEVYLPYDEMKNLIDQLPSQYQFKSTKRITNNSNEEMLNRLSSLRV
ncbi:hypothetical protein [Priestia endophytica]|uniref:Uncharacterized protein n=1 Tax=Priestia endophytica DSM 13796 TaxID=1121089 RepID=A0A1I6C0K0_9BACI|nr:hypothetical protein [Priestia endophytica]KYG33421.1 hypothetical protein AZF06_21490 [Priestia endophytica]SFQ86713.1 hypothetical protein SAMN02745910_04706 [Priestia endophytica DSM 13796]